VEWWIHWCGVMEMHCWHTVPHLFRLMMVTTHCTNQNPEHWSVWRAFSNTLDIFRHTVLTKPFRHYSVTPLCCRGEGSWYISYQLKSSATCRTSYQICLFIKYHIFINIYRFSLQNCKWTNLQLLYINRYLAKLELFTDWFIKLPNSTYTNSIYLANYMFNTVDMIQFSVCILYW
jgi:hypothetical protein